jgi:hypothetical protein
MSFAAALNASPHRGVFAVTGGGSLLLSDLLTEPGASATVLEARVPYHERALAEFIGAQGGQAASLETACAMGMAAFERARALAGADDVFGFALTASLATRTPKRGTHRVHAALQTLDATRAFSLALEKDARTRRQEEELCRDLAVFALGHLLRESYGPPAGLLTGERIETATASAPPAWQDLLAGRVAVVARPDSAAWPRALLPGAFNPLHDGHRAMARHAEHVLGTTVAFELCTRNVDKPPLDYLTVRHRLSQFEPDTPVWLTRAATFVEKARRFPGATFVVGTDTLARIAAPRYYGGDRDARDQAVTEMRERGAGFLVFGRRLGDRFVVLEDLELPGALQALCTGVPESEFRDDVSSTALRTRARRGGPISGPTPA